MLLIGGYQPGHPDRTTLSDTLGTRIFSDISFTSKIIQKTVAREFAVDDYGEDFTPFEEAFIPETHQGYSLYYFRQEDLSAPDPQFWIYVAKEPVKSIGIRFSEWLRELAEHLPQEVEWRNRLPQG